MRHDENGLTLCEDCDDHAIQAAAGKAWCMAHFVEHEEQRTLPAPRCDFCSSTELQDAVRYEVTDFRLFGVQTTGAVEDWMNSGDYLVCQPCHRLVEADDWAGLTNRSITSFAVIHGSPQTVDDPTIKFAIGVSVAQFRQHWTGKTTPLDTHV